MTRRVLPATEARCRPMRECPLQDHCARFQSPVPAHGATVEDNWAPLIGMGGCRRYVSITTDAAAPAAPVVHKHWGDRS